MTEACDDTIFDPKVGDSIGRNAIRSPEYPFGSKKLHVATTDQQEGTRLGYRNHLFNIKINHPVRLLSIHVHNVSAITREDENILFVGVQVDA